MTLLADRLEQAGYKTFEAQFAKLAFDAIRKYPESVVDAWREVGTQFGYEYLRKRMKDMQPAGPAKEPKSPPTPFSTHVPSMASRPYRPQQKVDRAKLQTAKAKAVEIMFGYKMADGRDLAEVGAHEIDKFAKDGRLMAEVKKELPQLSGNMRFANLGEILTVEQVNAARKRAQC